MDWWRQFLFRLRALLCRRDFEADMAEEMRTHLAFEAESNRAAGMAEDEARAAARRRFGSLGLAQECCRDERRFLWLEQLGQDLRYAARQLRRQPTFAAAALLTLGLGLGATVAIFSVVHGVLLKPLPYPRADELVTISHAAPGENFGTEVGMSPSMVFTYGEESRVFAAVGGWIPDGALVTGVAEPERVRVLLVTAGLMRALAIPPQLGRALSAEDDGPAAPEVVMLSHGYWQRRFGGDRGVIGRSLTVEGRPRAIVGVLPPSVFRFMGQNPDILLPFRLDRARANLGDLGFQGIARLKPGVTLAEANADVARMIPLWLQSWPAPGVLGRQYFENARFSPALRLLKTRVVGGVSDMLWLILGTTSLVLLIACANVANLLLVRAEARRQERGIRWALGASRGRIFRQSLAESLLLGAAGGALGLAVAFGGLRLLRFLAPSNLPRLEEIALDPPVLLFTLALSLLACLLAGVLPALKSARSHATPEVGGGRAVGLTRERQRTQGWLVVGQIALAQVLLVTAGLMLRTLQQIHAIEPGFAAPERVQTFRVSLTAAQTPQPERVAAMQEAMLSQLAAIPGVEAVGLANSLPMDDTKNQNPMLAESAPPESGRSPPNRTFKFVSPGFLAATGTRLVVGRELAWDDIRSRRPVALVSENLARELWGSPAAALGQRIRETTAQVNWREVIGIVADVRDDGVRKPAPLTVYWPFLMERFHGAPLAVQRNIAFAVRAPGAGTEALLRQVRAAVGNVDAGLPLLRIRTLQQVYAGTMAQASFTLVLLSIAGSMAVVLCAVGIYGTIAYTVEQRRREIGLRLALGASGAAVRTMFIRRGFWLAALGLAAGLLAAGGLSRTMASLLFGITPLDFVAYAASAAFLLVAALFATWLPARRAARVDPLVALRAE